MPKNIYSIKENYKKIEEVREVENQIPSYEEFVKNYNQERVNYEDLTYQDISFGKSSGPCSWNNPNCSCYASQGYTPLRMAYSNMTASNWYHSSGGYLSASDQPSCGTLLISSRGHIKCANCGTAGNWEQWKFKNLGYTYSPIRSSREFLNALQSAMEIYNDSHSRDIIRQLVVNLMGGW